VALTGFALSACGEDSAAPSDRRRDAGLADASQRDASLRDAGSCPRRRAPGLTQVPSEVVAPAGESSCKTYPARFLLVNNTSVDVHIERLTTESFAENTRFVVSTETALPHSVKPDEAISVALELFAPDEDNDTLINGNLVVHHDDGCDWMLVKGLVHTQGSTGGGPWAVDMGVYAPGERGEPVPIVFGFARVGRPAEPPANYSTLGVDPAPELEVVSGFDETPAPCDELTAWVRFNAPARRGVVEGVLNWEVETGELLGLAEIKLRALVR